MNALCAIIFYGLLTADSTQLYQARITSDFTRHSYYLAFNAIFEDYKGKVIIENDNLYSFVNEDGKLSKEEYQAKVLIMFANSSFDFPGKKIPAKGFIRVSDETLMDDKEAFLKKNFKNLTIRKSIKESEKPNIIYQLSKWNIAAKVDDESGFLIIRYPY